MKADGEPYQEGERIKLPDLARTLEQVAAHGVDWFYQGAFAQEVGRWMEANGGLIRAKDFETYRVRIREPISTTYGGYRVVGFPPPSSGGIHVAQMLNMLETFDLAQRYRSDPVEGMHIVAEAMKRAFADRAYWLGDADFTRVPRGLIEKSYARQLASSIDPKRATAVERHGTPPGYATNVFGQHTTHLTVADAEGYWVAITQTINTSFGSKVVVPGTGVVLNNEMDDFSIAPGVPNAFGLVGAEANAVAPGKRPLSSMSPTIIEQDGKPVLTVGAAGGPKIINQVLLALIRRIDRKLDLEQAIAAPRFHHQWKPDRLFVESDMPKRFRERLNRRGHKLQIMPSAGASQAIAVDTLPDGTRRFTAVSDPRVPGRAAGWDTRP